MAAGFYDHKGLWFPTQQPLRQQQMFDMAAASNMPPMVPHFHQAPPFRIPQGHRGGFRPPFPHHGQPRPNLIPIHPTQRGRHQADFQQQHHNHPPQAQEYPSEHQVIMPDNRELPMRVPQSTQSDVDTQNYVDPSVINSDQQAPSSGETLQLDVSRPPPLMEMDLGHVAPQGGRQLGPQQIAGHEHNVMKETMVTHPSYNREHDVNYAPVPNNYQYQTSHRDNFQHGTSSEQLQPQHYNKQHRNQRPWVDRNRAEPRGNSDHNPDQNQQHSSDGGYYQQQQAHKKKKKRKPQKKNHYTDKDSSTPYENCDQNADSNQEHDSNFQHEMPPRHQKQHKFRHDDQTEYHQQAWGGPVPYQNYNHRGRGRGGYRGQHPRNYNYKPRYQFDGHNTPQIEHKDGGENQQAERNSDLLQEPAPLESPAMVAAAVSPEKTADENSCEAIVNDIINSAAPEEGSGIVEIPEEGSVIVETPEEVSGIVETPEEGPVIVDTAEENQTTAELPDLSYIYTMNLVELQSLCSNICRESKNFWGPLEKMPHMVTKIKTVIEILPHKCKDQSKVAVLVQDMEHCLSLLESRAPMIESAGNDDYESSDSEEDEMHQTVSHIGMLAIGLYTRVRLNPVPTTEAEIKILQQQITKYQTDLDQLSIAEDDQVLVQSVGNIQVLCNDTHDLLLHRASNAPSELYSYST